MPRSNIPAMVHHPIHYGHMVAQYGQTLTNWLCQHHTLRSIVPSSNQQWFKSRSSIANYYDDARIFIASHFTLYILSLFHFHLSSMNWIFIYSFQSILIPSTIDWIGIFNCTLFSLFPIVFHFKQTYPNIKLNENEKKRSRDEKEYIGDGSVGTTTMRSMCQAHGKMSQLASVYVSRVCKEANASVWFIVSIHTLAPTCRQVSLIRCWSAMCCPGERKEKRGQM